jgi:hypothetical protein
MKICHLNLSTTNLWDFVKNPPAISTVEFSSKGPPNSFARLHLRLAYITIVPILTGVPRFELGYTRWEQVHEVLRGGTGGDAPPATVGGMRDTRQAVHCHIVGKARDEPRQGGLS